MFLHFCLYSYSGLHFHFFLPNFIFFKYKTWFTGHYYIMWVSLLVDSEKLAPVSLSLYHYHSPGPSIKDDCNVTIQVTETNFI